MLLCIFISSCSDDLKQEPLKHKGVIVGNYEPIWIKPHDPLGPGATSDLCPMPIIGDEIITTTHKDGKTGFCRLKIETGETVWSWFFDSTDNNEVQPYGENFGVGFFHLLNGVDYFITNDNKSLIFTSGSMHMRINLENGKMMWKKNIHGMTSLHYDGDEFYYINVANVYTPESSKYYNYYAYRVRIADGEIEEVFRNRTEPEFFGDCSAIPFTYSNKKYIFITEETHLDEFLTEHKNYVGLIDLSTGDTLMWKDFNSEYIDDIYAVHVHNNIIYVFTRIEYHIFDIDKLEFTQTIPLGKYTYQTNTNGERYNQILDLYYCHYFYNDKLVVGMDRQTLSAESKSGDYPLPDGFLIDIATNRIIGDINAKWHPGILDDIVYFADNHNLYAYDINTGKKLIDIEIPLCTQAVATSSVYKNTKGEKFVIVASSDYIYCYPGL